VSCVSDPAGAEGGHAARARLATTLRSDTPAAFIEDGVAIAAAIIIVLVLK
jgi:uncharacterized membrane protein